MAETSRVCVVCGAKYMTSRSYQRYCSRACSIRAASERRRSGAASATKVPVVCSVCGAEFTPHNGFQHYCSQKCTRMAANKRRYAQRDHSPRVCPVCGKSFVAHVGTQKYCSPKCFKVARAEWHRSFRAKQEQIEHVTAYKKEYYARPDVRARHAETTHAWAVANHDKVLEIKRRYKQSDKGVASEKRYHAGAAYRAARHRKDILRRWRKHNNGSLQEDKGIHWSKVAERQGSLVCSVCGAVCDPHSTDKGLHPTVDHIVPLIAGGPHVWDNVRLLCMRCNSAKTKQDIALHRQMQAASLQMEDPT